MKSKPSEKGKRKPSTPVITGTVKDISEKLAKAADKLTNGIQKPIEIRGAKLKDGFCNYTYELTTGVTAGDTCNRSGASIVHVDMRTAFNKLNVHLAVICEELDASRIDDISVYEKIDLMEDYKANSIEAKVLQFSVSEMQIQGTGENESVILTGTKKLSTGDPLQLKAPKISLSGGYLFVDELKAIIDELRQEVEEYMNGKAAPKMVQQEIFGEDGKEVVDEDHPE